MQQTAETLANLQQFLTQLNPSLNLDEMLGNVARQLVEMFAVDHSGVLLFEAEDEQGLVVAEYPAQGALGLEVPLSNYPLVKQLKRHQKPIAVPDAQHDPVMGGARATMRRLGIQSIVIIPLVVRGKIVGSLSLDSINTPREFNPDELALCNIIGNQIAVAVDYTRTLETVDANRHQAQTLREVNRVLNQSLNLDEILPIILEQLEKVLPADGSSIILLHGDQLQLGASRGGFQPFANWQIVRLEDLWGASQVVQTKSPLMIRDTDQHPHWNPYPGSQVKSWLGVPLLVRGEVVGVLNVEGFTSNCFSQTHLSLAGDFASQAALAIHNAQLYGQARQRADLLASVQEIGLRMASSLELQEVLRSVATSVFYLMEAHYVRIFLYEPETDNFVVAAALDAGGELNFMSANPIPPRKNGLTATVARTGRYFAISDTQEHPFYQGLGDYSDFNAIIGVPLKKRDEVTGVFSVSYKQPHHFTEYEIDLLQLLATQAAVALDNARMYSHEQTRLQEEARRVEQWRRVQLLTSTLNSSLDLEQVLNHACEQFTRLLAVDHCGIALFNLEGTFGQVVAEFPDTQAVGMHIPLDFPAARQMAVDGLPFASFNAQEDPLLGEARQNVIALGVKSILIAPLLSQGQVIGSVGLDAIQQERYFTAEEMNMIRIVADQMAIAVVNARTFEAERQARLQADTLREVAAILSGTLDLREVLERILAQLERVIKYDSSSIIFREDDNFRIVATRGFPDPASVIGLSFKFVSKRHFQEIARTRQPLVIPDTHQFDGWQQIGPTPIRSWIGAPLLASDRLLGLLAVDSLQPDFYTQADGELVTAFADLAAVALENARLYEFEVKQVEQELEIARRIQQGFLPQRIPSIPGWEIAAICLPARETGGDFYEFVNRADRKLGIAVGDVSGKSIPAAMLMAAAQSVVKAKGSDHRSPARVMAETNRLLRDDVPAGTFVALTYALLSPEDNRIFLSNGGQLAPFLVPASGRPIELIETPGPRLPLGIISDVVYEEMVLALAPGDALVFHTDGLVECMNAAGDLLGFEAVAALLEQMRGQPPDVVLANLLTAAREFAAGSPRHDDETLLVVQRQLI